MRGFAFVVAGLVVRLDFAVVVDFVVARGLLVARDFVATVLFLLAGFRALAVRGAVAVDLFVAVVEDLTALDLAAGLAVFDLGADFVVVDLAGFRGDRAVVFF